MVVSHHPTLTTKENPFTIIYGVDAILPSKSTHPHGGVLNSLKNKMRPDLGVHQTRSIRPEMSPMSVYLLPNIGRPEDLTQR